MQQLTTNLRYAARQLIRAPGYSLTVILLLALGIGTATAVVSVVDHVVFRPLALPESERLVTLCEVHDANRDYCSVSTPDAADWGSMVPSIEAVGIARYRSITIHHGSTAASMSASMATPGFLKALGVIPEHGRLFAESDMMPGGTASVVVLSHELWMEQFGGSPGIIGRNIIVSSDGDGRILDHTPMTVIGVLPAGIDVPRLNGSRAWIPLQMDAASEQHRSWRGFVSLARMKPGATIEQLSREMDAAQERLAVVHPADVKGWNVEVHRLREYVTSNVRPLMLLFLGAVGLVLAIVFVNVITLLIARATRRDREFGVLVALGATQGRVMQQLAAEALLLVTCGSALGVLVASWLVRGLVFLAPPGLPRVAEIAVDRRILVIMLPVIMMAGVIVGLLPVWRFRLTKLHDMLRQGRSTTGGQRSQQMRRILVVSQLALALALITSATLLVRSFSAIAAYNPGFDIDNVLTFQVFPPMSRYDSREKLRDFYRRITNQVGGVPGVVSVGLVSAGPLFGGGDGLTPFIVHGRDEVPNDQLPTAAWFNTGAGYFPTVGVPVVKGRNFDANASGDIVEILINETMARRFWPNASPIGARLTIPQWQMEAEVVGVVPDTRAMDGSELPTPALYASAEQRPRGASYVVVRTRNTSADITDAVKQAVRTVDADVDPRHLSTMRDLLSKELIGPRFNMTLISVFAILALILSTAGVYALMAYVVTLRTREFGIRMALGARATNVLRTVLADSGKLVAAGLGIGLLFAYFFTRLLRGLIHGIAPTDFTAALGAVLILAAAALIAALGPGIRAARTQPSTVLRAD